jgi:quercetin dioxygenase-like cupin family protein
MGYAKINIDDVDDSAPGFGVDSGQARFVRDALGAERIGMAHYRVKPSARLEFGHRHKTMEEAYVVVAGSGTFRVDDELIPVGLRDVVRVDPTSWRAWEAGPDGLELLAFGEHVAGDDESELEMGWWPAD